MDLESRRSPFQTPESFATSLVTKSLIEYDDCLPNRVNMSKMPRFKDLLKTSAESTTEATRRVSNGTVKIAAKSKRNYIRKRGVFSQKAYKTKPRTKCSDSVKVKFIESTTIDIDADLQMTEVENSTDMWVFPYHPLIELELSNIGRMYQGSTTLTHLQKITSVNYAILLRFLQWLKLSNQCWVWQPQTVWKRAFSKLQITSLSRLLNPEMGTDIVQIGVTTTFELLPK